MLAFLCVTLYHCLQCVNISLCDRYNVKSTLQLVDRFMLMPSTVSTAKFAQNGELFAKLRLNSDLSEDTSHGRLILQNINTVYVAPYNPLKQEESPSKVCVHAHLPKILSNCSFAIEDKYSYP